MRLDQVDIRLLRMPMVEPLAAAHGCESVREITVLRVDGGNDAGWGECAALAGDTYSGETAAGAFALVRDVVGPELLASPLGGPSVDILARVALTDPMVAAAVEMAVLDLELRVAATSLSRHLGAVRERVTAGAAVGLDDETEVIVERARSLAATGYRRIKVKIMPGHDVDIVDAVRAVLPAHVALQVDANGSYDVADREHLRALDALDRRGLALIEQPLAAGELEALATLARRLDTPICLDESLTSPDAVRRAVDLGACEVACLKPGRLGGVLVARAVHDDLRRRGVPTWIGGMIETGIGRAANLALAALPGCTLPGDLSATGRWFEHDLTASPVHIDADGTLPVPRRPGLGVEIDVEAVERFTVDRASLTSSS
ncbi:MAG TPA: o-succinylbenzoate synthase [Acidimicrobiales bacterium]|nr:o-succinylbenzoate synthase [Acidimicrobiales bacterium]